MSDFSGVMQGPHQGQPVYAAGRPLGEAGTVMLMLHGRGAGARDILSLVPELDRPDVTYLAPQAAGYTWYPYPFLAPLDKNEPNLSSALAAISELMMALAGRGIDPTYVVLLGFSQGACLTLEYAVRHARRYGGVIGLSGGLIGPPGTQHLTPRALEGTPVFLGCSDVDPHIPAARVQESSAVLRGLGAEVTERLYRGMGHTINADEIEAVRRMIDGIGRET